MSLGPSRDVSPGPLVPSPGILPLESLVPVTGSRASFTGISVSCSSPAWESLLLRVQGLGLPWWLVASTSRSHISTHVYPLYPYLFRVFIINECWFVGCFFCIYWDDHMVFILHFAVMYDTDLWINPTWSCCMIFSVYCWIWFVNILLRIFASMFIRNTRL